MEDILKIRKCGDYYTVYNKSHLASNKNHTHFKEYKGAILLKKLVERKEVPRKPYFKDSALRVSIDEDYRKRILTDS